MVLLAVFAIALILAFTAKPKKQQGTTPGLIDDSDIPLATAGNKIPAIFGTVRIDDPNCVDYRDIEYKPIKK